MNRILTFLIIIASFNLSQIFAQQLEMEELWKKTTEFDKYFLVEKSIATDNVFLLKGTTFGANGSTIEEWDPNLDSVVNSFQINPPISSITSEPSGKYLICTYYQHRFAIIIDLEKGQSRIQALPIGDANTGFLRTKMLPQGQFYAAYDYKYKKIYLVDIDNANVDKEYELPGIESVVYYSRDANYFAYYTSNKKIIVRDLPSGIETTTFDVDEKPNSMDFVDLNNLIVTYNLSSSQGKIVSYDVMTGNENYSIESNDRLLYAAESGDSNWLYFASLQTWNLYLYNKSTKAIHHVGYDFQSQTLVADNESDLLYIINREGNFDVVSAETRSIVKSKVIQSPNKQKYIGSVKFLPNMKYVVTSGVDGDLIFHNPLTGDFEHRINLDMESIRSLDISEDSKRVIVSDESGNTKIVNIENLEQSFVEKEYYKGGRYFSRYWDDDTFIVGGIFKDLLFVSDEEEKNIMPEDKYFTPLDMAISPDRNKIVFSTAQQKLFIFTRASSNEDFEYETEFWADSTGGGSGVKSVRFSKDGNYLITSSSAYKSRIWDANTYEMERAYESKEGNRDPTISSSILSNDGQYVFHCDEIPTLRVFERSTGNVIDEKLDLMPNSLVQQSYMDLSSDGKLLVLVSGNGTFYMFDIYGAVSVNERADEGNQISIFPNPTHDYINISSTDMLGANEFVDAQICNVLGEPVMNLSMLTIAENGSKIDVSHLSSGVYYLRIGKITKSFVKF